MNVHSNSFNKLKGLRIKVMSSSKNNRNIINDKDRSSIKLKEGHVDQPNVLIRANLNPLRCIYETVIIHPFLKLYSEHTKQWKRKTDDTSNHYKIIYKIVPLVISFRESFGNHLYIVRLFENNEIR